MKPEQSKSLLHRYVALSARRGGLLLLLGLLTTAAGAWLASRVRVDTRLEALLPADARSVVALEEAERRVPVRSTLFLLITSPDAGLNRRVADTLVEEVRAWPETRWAVTARSPEGLWDRRILFAPAEALEGWASAVEDRLAWERCEKVPGCVNFDDKPPLPTEAEVRARLGQVPELASLARFFGEKGDAAAEAGSEADLDAMPEGRLCNEDGTLCAIEASLSVSARDMATATRVLDRAQSMIERLRPSDAPDSLRVEVSGPFRNAPLTKRATERDLAVVSVVSTLLVLGVLLFMFRGLRPALVILVPMFMATSWVLGMVGLVDIELNLISAFTFAILVGIGTDYGLHLASHYGAERARGHDAAEAMEATLRNLVASLSTAAATTAFAFASLTIAAFKGFAQMGALAALGVGACLVAYLFFVPPMILFLDRILPQKRSWNRQLGMAGSTPSAPRYPRARVLLGLVLGLGLAYAGRNVAVETDFRNLRPEGIAHGLPTNDAVHGTSGVGIQIIGDDPAEVQRATWAVHDATIGGFLDGQDALAITAETFLPADQGRRMAAIARLREALDDAARLASERDRQRIDAIRPLVAVDRPITPEELPPWISDWLVDNDGELGHLGLVFLRTRGTDAVLMEQLARILDRTSEAHPNVVIASAQVVLGEVLPGLFHDGPLMVALSLIGLCLAVWGLGRKLSRVGWVLLPLVLGAAMTTGLMALLDLKLTLYNLLVLPVAFGVGVDGAVYVTYADEESRKPGASHDAMADSRRAILGATITTITGFGSLVLSHHLGIVSIGWLGALAISVTMFTNLVWLPPLLHLWNTRGGRGAKPVAAAPRKEAAQVTESVTSSSA